MRWIRKIDGAFILKAVFTNITHDHLDYHKHFWPTSRQKIVLIIWKQSNLAIINADDRNGKTMVQKNTKQM